MTTIDPRSTLLAGLRDQLATQRMRAQARGAGRAAAVSSGATVTAGVSTVVAQRIRGLDPEDPDRPGKAVRLFLESELVREFGDPLLNDPAFAQMVDTVQQQMREDRDTAAALDALGAWLVAQHSS